VPKSFSSEEQSEIRESLLNTGEDLFSTFGLKKTTVEELTESVGIAKGSFYKFFDSKEALYYEVYRREEKKMKGRVLMTLYGQEFSAAAFADFLLEAIKQIEKYPIMRRMYLENEYKQVIRKIPQSYLDEHTSEDISELTPLIRQWQESGQMIQRDPEIITSAIRGFFILVIHKDDIGEEYYDETVEFMAQCLAEGLVTEKETTHD